MRVRDASELEELLALGHETRSFEVKGPGELSDKRYVAKAARAAMAMGNLRGGGLVCLGIDEDDLPAMLPGLSVEQVTAWTNYDDVHDAIARYCEPPVSFEPQQFTLSSSVTVVVLAVEEFDTVPHICAKDYPGEVNVGELYVRTAGKPQSRRANAREMREVLDAATDKGVREFLRRARATGTLLGADEQRRADDESARFERERAQAWEQSSAVLERLAGLGHTDVAIRPGPYDGERIGPGALVRTLEDVTVRMRGWPVPYIDNKIPIDRFGDFIGQDIEPTVVPHLEAWRLLTSGQFLHRRALSTDMRDSPMLEATDERATGAVAVWDVVLYMIEVAELAARLVPALSCEQVAIDVHLAGVAGRQLIAGDDRESLRAGLIIARDRVPAHAAVTSEQLLADPRAVGVSLAQALLSQFGLELPDSALLDLQARIFGS